MAAVQTSEALNLSDFEVVRDLGVDGNGDDVEEYLGSDARSLPHQPMPLPKPPVGFMFDDHGRVMMASAAAKRIVTIVSFVLLYLLLFLLFTYQFPISFLILDRF